MEAYKGVALCQAGPRGREQSKPTDEQPIPQNLACSPEVGESELREETWDSQPPPHCHHSTGQKSLEGGTHLPPESPGE